MLHAEPGVNKSSLHKVLHTGQKARSIPTGAADLAEVDAAGVCRLDGLGRAAVAGSWDASCPELAAALAEAAAPAAAAAPAEPCA